MKFRKRRLGAISFLLFSLVMFIIGVILTFKYKFLPSFDVLLFTGTELYISPWTRIIPYAVGVFCGWFLKKYRKTFNVSDVSKKNIYCIWEITKNLNLNCKIFPHTTHTETPQFYVLFVDTDPPVGTSRDNSEGHKCSSGFNVHFNWTTFDRHRCLLVHYNQCMWL